jgi:hypothetical protein
MATKKLSIEYFNERIDELAAMLLRLVDTEMGRRKWKLAYLDYRSAGKGARFGMIRVELPDGTMVSSLPRPTEIADVLRDVWNMKDKVFKPKWHGMKLVTHPDGKHDITYNYDPKCGSDPVFLKE